MAFCFADIIAISFDTAFYFTITCKIYVDSITYFCLICNFTSSSNYCIFIDKYGEMIKNESLEITFDETGEEYKIVFGSNGKAIKDI